MIKQDYPCSTNDTFMQNMSQRIQIYFSVYDLRQQNLIDHSNISLKVYLEQSNKSRKVVLQTRSYHNHQNHDFVETLEIDYFFQIRQKLIIQFYKTDFFQTKTTVLQTSVGQIFSHRQKGLLKQIIHNNNQYFGKLIIRSQMIQKLTNDTLQFSIKCQNIHNDSGFLCFNRNKCFFRLYKKINCQDFLIYESPNRTGNFCHFSSIKLKQNKFCNKDKSKPTILKFYKRTNFCEEQFIGETQVFFSQLKNDKLSLELQRNKKNKGRIIIQDFKIHKKHSFTDFIMAGMNISLEVCIDFTGSNGDPKQRSSLHYFDQTTQSQYQKALEQVCQILVDYDKKKLVPIYGFGAQFRQQNNNSSMISHYFPLNGNQIQPEVIGIKGIIKAYRQCVPNLILSGPSNIAPSLCQTMNKYTSKSKHISSTQYKILIILTDGDIHDQSMLKDLLIQCARLPLSIILIGIGNGPWNFMRELDDDDCQMRDSMRNLTQRDLVQFVQFNRFNQDGFLLAKQLLEEIPHQVVEYHELSKINPSYYLEKNQIIS